MGESYHVNNEEVFYIISGEGILETPYGAHYPKSNKVGIIVNGQSSTFYKKNTNIDYYEGE